MIPGFLRVLTKIRANKSMYKPTKPAIYKRYLEHMRATFIFPRKSYLSAQGCHYRGHDRLLDGNGNGHDGNGHDRGNITLHSLP
jgi:hypothetical protein